MRAATFHPPRCEQTHDPYKNPASKCAVCKAESIVVTAEGERLALNFQLEQLRRAGERGSGLLGRAAPVPDALGERGGQAGGAVGRTVGDPRAAGHGLGDHRLPRLGQVAGDARGRAGRGPRLRDGARPAAAGVRTGALHRPRGCAGLAEAGAGLAGVPRAGRWRGGDVHARGGGHHPDRGPGRALGDPAGTWAR